MAHVVPRPQTTRWINGTSGANGNRAPRPSGRSMGSRGPSVCSRTELINVVQEYNAAKKTFEDVEWPGEEDEANRRVVNDTADIFSSNYKLGVKSSLTPAELKTAGHSIGGGKIDVRPYVRKDFQTV